MIQNFDHPFNDQACIDRLVSEIRKYGAIYIAYDFDNTIFDYHDKGGNYQDVIDLLVRATNAGHHMVLFTSESKPDILAWKKEYIKKLGIGLDYINETPVIKGVTKPYYNILLDDRAGLESACRILSAALDQVEISQP